MAFNDRYRAPLTVEAAVDAFKDGEAVPDAPQGQGLRLLLKAFSCISHHSASNGTKETHRFFFPFHFPVLELFPTAFLILTQIQYAFEYNLTLSLDGDTKAAILCEINDSFVH